MNSRKNSREFLPKTKALLGERVAYMCCNPLCRRLTIKPHTTEKKSIRLGEAGHINGLSTKGPRYDSTKSDDDIRSYDNGIWLCDICHKLVDKENSIYDKETLIKWKVDTENYVESLVIQDTRLRQLRLLCQNHLSALRILSGLPTKLDQTFENPNGNGINLTRLFMELELVLFDNHFVQEANLVQKIVADLDKVVCPFVHFNTTGNQLNISPWKNASVKILMIDIMRYSSDSYSRYYERENQMVISELERLKALDVTPSTIDLKATEIEKIITGPYQDITLM